MIKFLLLIILISPSLLFAQYQRPMHGSSLIFGGISYNPYDKDAEYIQSFYGISNKTTLKGNLALMAGYHTERNFDKNWGYGITVPLSYYIMNESIPKTDPVENLTADDDYEIGSQYTAGIGLCLELYYQFKFKGEIMTGIEANYLLGNRYFQTHDKTHVYTKQNSVILIPTFYAGIRYYNAELTWNYFRGLSLKVGFVLDKSPL